MSRRGEEGPSEPLLPPLFCSLIFFFFFFFARFFSFPFFAFREIKVRVRLEVAGLPVGVWRSCLDDEVVAVAAVGVESRG